MKKVQKFRPPKKKIREYDFELACTFDGFCGAIHVFGQGKFSSCVTLKNDYEFPIIRAHALDIHSYVSMILHVVTSLNYGVFLFTIIEYIFETEKIFYKEKCGDDPITDETVLCQEAREYYNFIFTCCIISAVSKIQI